jgi:hypothetical protein
VKDRLKGVHFQAGPRDISLLHIAKTISGILLLFILIVNGYLPSGSSNTLRHNTQTTHHTK